MEPGIVIPGLPEVVHHPEIRRPVFRLPDGRHDLRLGGLAFRHIAEPQGRGEVSGHYHPKARIAGQSRRCFLYDERRLILPAYGAYTGGLASSDAALAALFGARAVAVLTGPVARPLPMPR